VDRIALVAAFEPRRGNLRTKVKAIIILRCFQIADSTLIFGVRFDELP
jgi:hypothetical protein